jgi:carbon-monoxide dehydrogenase medium subunit
MKPAPFDYAAPTDLSDAVALLAERPATTTVLAGGQSLLIDLHFRLHRPALLVDINNVSALAGIAVDGDGLRVGALARHRAFETPDVAPGPLGRLLNRISPFIAHPPIRARGTMAGSLVFAYPGGEWCTMAVALDAAIELTGPAGSRTVAAGDFFFGPEEGPLPPGGFLFIGQKKTARQPDEILTSVRLPLLPGPDAEADAVGVGFCEQRRGHTGFAQVCVVAVLTTSNGVISGARLGLGNAADRPLRAHDAEACLLGQPPGQRVFARAAELAMAAAVPVAEPYAGVEYKRHTVGVLVRRALTLAYEDAEDQHRPRGVRREEHDDSQRTGRR